jgi:dihydroorotate dehydrogenase
VSWYTSLARPLLFALDAERAHDLTMAALRFPGTAPLLAVLSPRPTTHDPRPNQGPRPGATQDPSAFAKATADKRPDSLAQHLLGLDFPNPVGLGAGLDKQGTAVSAWGALGFGFAEIGTVTPRPQPGNPKPRLFRLPADHAVINRFGFNSEGAETVARNLAATGQAKAGHNAGRAEARHDAGPPQGGHYVRSMRLGINVGKNKDTPNDAAADDYVKSIEALHAFADYFVVNVSSPNTAGLRALQDQVALRPLLEQCVSAARRASGRLIPVLVKVSPDMTDDELVRSVDAALEGGALGVIATNTTLSREGLQAPEHVTREAGGLSGMPLRQRSHHACRVLHRHLQRRVPIIGVGGIFTPDDAYHRIRSGASLIQVYTALIYEGPGLAARLVRGLAERLERDGFTNVEEAIGIDAR